MTELEEFFRTRDEYRPRDYEDDGTSPNPHTWSDDDERQWGEVQDKLEPIPVVESVRSVSTTMLNDMSCFKRYYFRHVLHLVPKPRFIGEPLRRGIWVHACLEAFHGTSYHAWQDVLSELVQMAQEDGLDPDKIQKIRGETTNIMEDYIDYYRCQSPLKLILPAEKEYAAVVGGRVRLTATMDIPLAEWKGALWIVEHKSTGQIPPPIWRAVDPQTIHQYYILTRNGIQPEGILFNYLLTRPAPVPQVTKDGRFYAKEITTTTRAFEQGADKIRAFWRDKGAAENRIIEPARLQMVNDSKFYAREPVFRPQASVIETLRDTAGKIRMLDLCEKTGFWPRNVHIMSCMRFCPYGDLDMIEYLTGKVAEGMRQELFDIDDGRREGRTAFARLAERVGEEGNG